MNKEEREKLISSGNSLIEHIQEELNRTLTTKYSYKDIFCRKKINAEEEELANLIFSYTDYAKDNLGQQKQLATEGGLNDRQYNQPSLAMIQSQKETVEFLMKSLGDNISSHNAQLNSYSGRLIAFAALTVAIISLVLSLVFQKFLNFEL